MKRLQFRNDSQVFQNRELALAFFANIANPEMGISDRFGDALYAEPMVVKYLDENGVEQVILAIGKDSGKTPYHLIDSAALAKGISELGEKADDLEGQLDSLSGSVLDNAVSVQLCDHQLEANVLEEYVLKNNRGEVLGEHIKIYKDSALADVQLGKKGATGATKVNGEYVLEGTFEGNEDAVLYFIYLTEEGDIKLVGIDFEKYLLEAEAGDGLYVDDNHVMSVKIDTDNDEGFLRVGPNGIKTEGILAAVQGELDSSKVYSKDILVQNTVSGTNLTIQVDGRTIAKNLLYENGVSVLSSPITLRDITNTNTDSTVKSLYALYDGEGNIIGDPIRIYNEGHLKNVVKGRTDTLIDPVTGNIVSDGVGEPALVFIYATGNGYQMASVAIADLVPASTFTEIYEKIDREVSGAVSTSKSYTDQRVSDLTTAIGSLTDTINSSVDAMTDLIDTKINQESTDRLAQDTALDAKITALRSYSDETFESKDNVAAKISSAVTEVNRAMGEASAATVAAAVAEINGVKVVDVVYDADVNSPKFVQLRLADGTLTNGFDASSFLVDGVLSNVEFDGQNLIFTWNDDHNTDITVPISSLSDIYTVASGSVSYLKIEGKEVSAIVDREGGFAKTLATTEFVSNNVASGKAEAIAAAETYADNAVAPANAAIAVLNGDESVAGSVLHIVDDKFAKDLITAGLPVTDVTIEDAREHSLLRIINVNGEDRYFASSRATDMYYVDASGNTTNLNDYITNLKNRIEVLEADNADLKDRVTALENATIDENEVKNIVKNYLEGTAKEIKIAENNDKLRIGFADDAIFGDFLASAE